MKKAMILNINNGEVSSRSLVSNIGPLSTEGLIVHFLYCLLALVILQIYVVNTKVIVRKRQQDEIALLVFN